MILGFEFILKLNYCKIVELLVIRQDPTRFTTVFSNDDTRKTWSETMLDLSGLRNIKPTFFLQ